MYDYQLELLDLLNKYSWLLINKSRKTGISECILRIIAFKCFNEYEGYQVLLCAGNRLQHAQRLMKRFQNLFDNISDHVLDKSANKLLLRNGTEILAMPSNDTALRGLERVKCIFLDEFAHTGLIDDSGIYDALAPNLDNTQGDFISLDP